MANESIIENFVRKHFINFSDDVIVEEQKSKNPRIDKLLKNASKSGTGKGYPDFIITFNEEPNLIAVVECKSDTRFHETNERRNYRDYAVDGTLLYASHLASQFDVLAIGVSGDENKQKVSHYFRFKQNSNFQQAFGDHLLPPQDYINSYLGNEVKFQQDYDALIQFTKELNERLHINKVSEKDRSILISSILIALEQKAFQRSYRLEGDSTLPKRLVDTATEQLRNSGLPTNRLSVLEQKFGFLLTETALTAKRGELNAIIQDVDSEVNSFVKTHRYRDVLSGLYVQFLQYANSDKGLGIVLTPTHITELFVELSGINHQTIVYDNCAGTGGFLITAMKRMIECAGGDIALEKNIKKNQLFGVELQSSIYPLAVSNMYINQDGKTNVYLGDCFDDQITKQIKQKKPTVGLLNPPYKADKRRDTEELDFVLNNLNCLQQHGVCIAILPMSSALATRGKIGELKKEIMLKHTLEAVLSMPDELFFNSKVGVVTCAMIFTAHRPHPNDKLTYFGYYKDDGFTKRKIKGRADYSGRWESIKKDWITGYMNRTEKPGFSVNVQVGPSNEWAAEAYMETDYSNMCRRSFINTIADYSTYLFRNRIVNSVSDVSCTNESVGLNPSAWQWFEISDLFKISGSKTTPLLELEEVGDGDYPFITTKATNNGVGGFFNYYTENENSKGLIVVDSAVIGYCSYQNQPFSASDHVEVLTPRSIAMDSYVAMFLVTILNMEQYRYNYGRKCSQSRLRNSKIKLPVTIDGSPDFVFMERFIKSLPYSLNLEQAS